MRASVGITTLTQGALYLADGGDPTVAKWIAGLLALASGVSLLIGFLTPIAGVLAGLGATLTALAWFHLSAPNLFEPRLSTVFAVTIAAAICCLGPGAFSVDARLFGRREIIIPHTPRSREP